MDVLLTLVLVCATFTPSYSLVNVARAKPATQSGTHKGWDASRALDGDRTPDREKGKCANAYTLESNVQPEFKGGPAWWRVDLGHELEIYEIKIFSSNNYPAINTDSWILVSNEEHPPITTATICNEITTTDLNVVVKCNYSNSANWYMRGRYVMVKKKLIADTSYSYSLQLCEVEVFSCPAGTWGMNLPDGFPDCVRKCPGSCQNGGTCRVSDGTCPSGCTDGFWGRSCDQECHCAGAGSCDVITGSCGATGCEAGLIVGKDGNCVNESEKSEAVRSNEDKGSNTGFIAGLVVMAVVVVALVILVAVLVVIVIRKRPMSPSENNNVDLSETKQPSSNDPAPIAKDNPGFYEELHTYEN